MNIFNYIPSTVLQFAKPQFFSQSTDQTTLRKISAIAALNLALAPIIAYILSAARKSDAESSSGALSLETSATWGASLFAPLATTVAKAFQFMHQGTISLLNGKPLEGATLMLGGYLSSCNHELYRWQNGVIRQVMKHLCKSELPDNAIFTAIENCGVSALNLGMTPLIGKALSIAHAMDVEDNDGSKEALVLCASTVAAPLATAQATRNRPTSMLTAAILILTSQILTYVYPIHQRWQGALVDRVLKK